LLRPKKVSLQDDAFERTRIFCLAGNRVEVVMGSVPLLIVTILLLILVNGLFACMEIAMVSVSKARLKRFEKEKRAGASTAIALHKDIDSFFATVQIGVTFIASLCSAIGGASAVEIFSPLLTKFGITADSASAHVISVLTVTVLISYVTLVIGELAPKSIARRYPGRISLLFARAFKIFAQWTKPAIWVLTASTRCVLRIIGIMPGTTLPGVTPEEFRLMASELLETRQISASVYDMLVRATRLTQTRVEDVMIPRHRIVAVKADSKSEPSLREKIIKTYRKHPFTNFPVIDRKGENVLGMINVKDLLLSDDLRNTSKILRQPAFTARGQTLDRVLAAMQQNNVHLSVVVDEHGIIDGIITLEDILEELIGEIEGAIPSSDGSTPIPDSRKGFVVDGLITLHELNELHSISLPQSLYYSTLAGFVLDKMGKIPASGEHVDYEGWRIEVLAMEGNRIKELKITPLKHMQSDTGSP
jgi:magnesium and cobalt exporter, CNNM family